MTDPNRLIDAYLDGTLSHADFDQLAQDLAASPAYAEVFARAMLMDTLLKEGFEREAITSTMRLDDGAFLSDQDLSVLVEDYRNADAKLIELDKAKPVRIRPGDASVRVLPVLASEAGSTLRKLARTRAGWLGAAAAAVLLSLWLVNPFARPEQDERPAAQTTGPAPAVVAHLSAEHDAVWAVSGGATSPTVGDALAAGQRLTLTEGFAEITTNRGAVAILEAPATIEILDKNNALELHSGKLVGICETPSSKGLLVRTPQMDIIDLGTEFGVDSTRPDATEVHVFEGQVTVAAVSPGFNHTPPVYLTQGQSAQVDTTISGQVERFVPSPGQRFVRNFKAIAQPPQAIGQIEYQPALPMSLAPNVIESDLIQLFMESTDIALDAGYRVTLTETGQHESFRGNAPLIDAERVDVYLVHYDFKVGGGDPQSPRRANIRFDRPILGVIADDATLFASDRLFAHAGMDFGPDVNPNDSNFAIGRGLESKGGSSPDVLDISEDRRTLTLELYSNMAIDQFRILVQSPESTAP